MDLRIAPSTVQHQVVQKLHEAIFTGHFQPGERLVEARLCTAMGVSRPSLREALRRLESERLIDIIPNRGPSVVRMDWDEAHAIYRTRALLEGEAAALCAGGRRADQIMAMRNALADFAGAVRDNAAIDRLETTRRFYSVLLEACGNPIIKELLEGLLARINFLRARSMSQVGRAKQSAMEMRRILTAIERSDVDGARAAAIAHVNAASTAAKLVFEAHSRKVA